jgi:hypothetical protein
MIISEFRQMEVRNVWMHELPMPETPKLKVKVVGPYDVAGSDVDLLKDTMCHYLG